MKIFLIAAEPVVEATKWSFGADNFYNNVLIVALVIVMLMLLITAIVVHRAMKALLRVTMPDVARREEEEKLNAKTRGQSKWNRRWEKLAGLRPIEEEKDLMIDHEFDGIRELDNPVPLWFNALFYSTIIFGIGYLFIYQFSGIGLNQDQEYVVEMDHAEIEKQEFLAKAGNQVDETSVTYNPALAPAGKAIYMANCAVCHGNDGEGTIGPNLTDNFWLHGGDIKDIFRTVKYGVPEKGMVPWEQTLTPAQMAEVSSYILSLQGSNPPNPKAPQGDEYIPASAETTTSPADTVAN